MPRKKATTATTEAKVPKVSKAKKAAAVQPSVADHFPQQKKSTAKAGKAKKEVKRRTNRFPGMTEEEVAARGLPDYLREGLDLVIIGINPSLAAAYSGKYYDGPGNHFWTALYLSGLVPTPMAPQDDHKLLDHGIGFTNVCARTTRGLADLSKQEIKEGAEILRAKLAKFKPKVAVFNGKSIYQVYSGSKKFMFGKQPEPLEGGTWVWVMPSSSALVAQLPRAVDKVPFYQGLKKFLAFLKGETDEVHEEEIVFSNVVLKNVPRKKLAIKEEPKDHEEEQEEYAMGNGMASANGFAPAENWGVEGSIITGEDVR